MSLLRVLALFTLHLVQDRTVQARTIEIQELESKEARLRNSVHGLRTSQIIGSTQSTQYEGVPWESCLANSPTTVSIDSVILDPEQPKRSNNLVITISGTATEEVVGGTITTSVEYLNVKVLTVTKSLCDTAKCPLGPGPIAFVGKQSLPWIAPPGLYSVTWSLKDPQGDPLACVKFNFTMVW
jgi:hypothetical protein